MTLALALAAGLLLFLSDQPLHWWPLQFVALLPWWLALAKQRRSRRPSWVLGFCFAVGYATPLLIVLGWLPPFLVVAVAGVVQWMLVATVCGRLLVRSPVLGAVAAAAAMTLIEIAVWYAVPLFGTAQCFARPLSAWPQGVAFTAFTGMAGLVFVLTAVQALLVNAFRERRGAPALAAVALIAVVAALDVVRWTRPLGPPLRIATYGWGDDVPTNNRELVGLLDSWVAEARKSGAHLLVTPETGFSTGDRQWAITAFGGLARKHGMATAFGVWHNDTGDNRIWFFDAEGRLRAEYRKTHLVPWMEDYPRGDGTLAISQVGDVAVGGMICQDDNFTDLARGYGSKAVPLLAVPTNDWAAIRGFHLENALFRAIENGYAVARAASNGISALVSPRGEVLASCDHTAAGPRFLVGDVPTGDGAVTLYARFGEWPIVLLSVLLIAAALRRKK